MKLDDLRERIIRLNSLLYKPEPGLFSWNMMLGEQMQSLVKEWTKLHDVEEPEEMR